MLSKIAVLVQIAFANIFSSLLNVFIGLVLLFGAALLVIGASLFSTLDGSLSHSIVDSISGHLQVYGSHSKDPLEIYGKIDGSDSNLAPIEDFKALKTKLLTVPNVSKVVPMGGSTALISSGNTVDVTLEKLRTLYRNQDNELTKLTPEAFAEQLESRKRHVQSIVAVLSKDLERAKELVVPSAEDLESIAALAKASTPEFWASFDADPLAHLEFLENKVAPVVADSDLLFIRCLGTDLDAFQETFARMTIVEGAKVPTGHRGILLPRFFYEEALKLKNARRLDKIRDALAAGRKLADQTDKELQRFVKENQAQTREIVLQLDGLATKKVTANLQALLKSTEPDLSALLPQFFSVTDDNFEARYAFFYKELAPLLSLYRVKVGDEITLRSFGRSGSLETASVTVYGIFELRGLEKSPLAGANALLDIVTFRDLYGFLTAERRAELEAMKAAAGASQLSRDNAEAALFGGDAEVVTEVKAAPIEQDVTKGNGPVKKRKPTFDLRELDEGMVLNAAVLLADGSPLAQVTAAEAVERLLAHDKAKPNEAIIAAAKQLAETGQLPFVINSALRDAVALEATRATGADPLTTGPLLALQQALKAERASISPEAATTIDQFIEAARPAVWVVSWNSAAGFLGKFIDFFRLLLVAVVFAFAFIALIVVTIGMTIATLQRTSTIGTMRAIGAQRGFVVAMVLSETVVLALAFGLAGAGVGAAIVTYLHHAGIPAFRDELYFFFSGPVLRPELTAGELVLSVAVTLVVSVLAVLFPTALATRIAPVTAMQATD